MNAVSPVETDWRPKALPEAGPQAQVSFSWQPELELLLLAAVDVGAELTTELGQDGRLSVVVSGSRRQVRAGMRALEEAARRYGATQARGRV